MSFILQTSGKNLLCGRLCWGHWGHNQEQDSVRWAAVVFHHWASPLHLWQHHTLFLWKKFHSIISRDSGGLAHHTVCFLPLMGRSSCCCDLQFPWCLSFLSIVDTRPFYLQAMLHLTNTSLCSWLIYSKVEFCCLQPNSLIYVSCVLKDFHHLTGKMNRETELYL